MTFVFAVLLSLKARPSATEISKTSLPTWPKSLEKVASWGWEGLPNLRGWTSSGSTLGIVRALLSFFFFFDCLVLIVDITNRAS